MIARILGEGQYDLGSQHLGELNELDARVQAAVESGDEPAFTAALRKLLEAVRRLGTPLPDDVLTASELVLPDQETSLDHVRALLADDGLIPG